MSNTQKHEQKTTDYCKQHGTDKILIKKLHAELPLLCKMAPHKWTRPLYVVTGNGLSFVWAWTVFGWLNPPSPATSLNINKSSSLTCNSIVLYHQSKDCVIHSTGDQTHNLLSYQQQTTVLTIARHTIQPK